MRMTKEERLIKSRYAAGLDEMADEKEREAPARGESRRLSAYMKQEGARLFAEDVPGLGRVYRSPGCTTSPFGPTSVEKWCVKNGKPLPEPRS